MFCDICGSLLTMGECREIGCANSKVAPKPSPIKRPSRRTPIPPDITYDAKVGILGFYRYTTKDEEIIRRSCLLSLYTDELVTESNAVNQSYIDLLGSPESDKRVSRICETLLGLNVPSQVNPHVKEIRVLDAEFLQNYHIIQKLIYYSND